MFERPSTTEGALETSSSQGGLQAALGAHYELERELGRGGMATVYLARDLRHRRQVAVKVLHPELSAVLGTDRFLREIEVTAALQHPHILPLFDSGSANGLLYYVMPYVAGESLRARLTREQQLPIDDAIRLAREVADALDHAHAQGIVHRDIKPENILLQGGHALVADFGVALAVQQAGGQRMTQTGLSLGTPQYMAPEQATGEKTVDARADVYALGAVTYEMITGEPPFTGVSTQAVIAKLLTDDPVPLTRHRRSVPSHVEGAVLRALEKLPADRLPSAGAFATALVQPAAEHRVARPGPRAPQRRHVTLAVLAGVATGALTIGLALGWALGRESVRSTTGAAPLPRVRFAIDIDSGSLSHAGALAISPDGRTVVYGLDGPDGAHLYARPLDTLVSQRLAGTEDAEYPFFSPDGSWVAFYSHGALRKVPLAGGPAVVIAEVPLPAWFGGGTWSDTDTIFYSVPTSNALYRVSARGGSPSKIAVNDTGSASPFFPHILPGGRTLLVTLSTWDLADRIGVLDLASGQLRKLGAGSYPHYAAGNLIYGGHGGVLFRQPFDAVRGEPTGAAEQIVTGLAFQMVGVALDVSRNGALVYRPGSSPSAEDYLQLKLLDRTGRELQVIPARRPWSPRFSPVGRRIAYGAAPPGRETTDIWVMDLDAGTPPQRLTTDANNNNDAQWSPDGTRLAFSANAARGGKDLFVQPLDGRPARLLRRGSGNFQFSTDWTRQGDAVLFTRMPLAGDQTGNQDIWFQPADDSVARRYLDAAAHESAARVSTDGKWVAYHSDETGRYEVYVQAFPTPRHKTSVGVGIHPVWGPAGRELFFWRGDQLIAVTVTPGATNEPLKFGTPTPLFRAAYPKGTSLAAAMYDVSPNGKEFILVASHDRENRLVVALDALGAGRPR